MGIAPDEMQKLIDKDQENFIQAAMDVRIPQGQVTSANYEKVREYIIAKYTNIPPGTAVISQDIYSLAWIALKKVDGGLAPSVVVERPKNVGVMFSDKEDAATSAAPDSQFEDPRLAHNRRVDEHLSLIERRAMQGAGKLETQRNPDAGIVGLKSETEQVIRGGRISYGETERLQKANREHNIRVRQEYAAAQGKK
jgi:hypothetical protein